MNIKKIKLYENEIIFAKSGVAPSERNVTLGLF